jgi:hypothetical protein
VATTITPAWTENQTLHASAVLAAVSSTADDLDLANLGYDAVHIQVEVIFGGTPDGNVLVEVFTSPDSGTNDDTEPYLSFTIEDATSATLRKSFTILNVPFIRVQYTNNDTADNVTIETLYAGRKWSAA